MKKIFIVLLVVVLGFSLVLTAAPKKETKNFRLRLTWQPQSMISQIGFSENNYNVFESRSVESYYGSYVWTGQGELHSDTSMETFTKLAFQKGDVLPLRQLRTLNSGKSGQDFGIEAEFRPIGNFWLGASYNQTPIFTVSHYEEKDYLDVMQLRKMYDTFDLLTGIPMYVYYLEFARSLATRQVDEKFGSSNFQIYSKYEFGNDFISGFVGGGVDIWTLKRETRFQEGVYRLYPFSGKFIEGGSISRTEEEKNSYIRPFFLLGFNLSPVNGLNIGAQGKCFWKAKDATYYSRFMLPAPTDTWSFNLNRFSINIFISFGL